MQEMMELAKDIDASIYQITTIELMRWGHEDLLEGMERALGELGLGRNIGIHCKVGLDACLRHGPLHTRIKHICPDFILTDAARMPVALIDYLGAGHDACHSPVKQAVARKIGVAFLQVPAEWSFEALKAMLAGALAPVAMETPMMLDALGLQDMLRQELKAAMAA